MGPELREPELATVRVFVLPEVDVPDVYFVVLDRKGKTETCCRMEIRS